MEYYAGVFHVELSQHKTIENILKEYDVGIYLIGHEIEPYSHFHIVAQLPCKTHWTNFQKKLITRYDLRGKPGKNKPRQYGSIKEIRDIEKLKAYCVKDGNVLTNMTALEYNHYIEMSYKKENNRKFFDNLMDYLDTIENITVLKTTSETYGNMTTYSQESSIYSKIYKEILGYCIDEEYKVSPSQVKSWGYSFIQKTTHLKRFEKIKILMEKL